MTRKLLGQLRYILRRKRSESALEREIRFHIDMESRANVEAGMSEAEARRTALLGFGSLPQCHEAVREAWGLAIWSDLRRDFQYAFRMIRRKPAFAVITVLTLAAGIGANTAVFSVFDRTVMRPLPYRGPQRLVQLWETRTDQEFAQREASYPDFQDWKQRNHSYEDLAGYNGTNFTLTGLGVPSRISAVRVTTNMLSFLGVQPQLGRDFQPHEEAIGHSQVAIVTHGFWQRQFGGSPDVIGRLLRLSGQAYTVIGVTPPGFAFLPDGAPELLVPLGPTPDQLARRQFHWVRTIGRIRSGVAPADAERDLQSVARQLAAENPLTNSGTSVRLVPLHEQIVGKMRAVLLLVFAASGCMLCLAFVNLANLMVAQFTAREREMAIRSALGAGTFRLGRQLLAECLVLAGVASLASIAVARAALAVMLTVIPRPLLSGLPSLGASPIDGRVLAFNAMLALLGGLFVGLVVIVRSSRIPIKDALNWGARGSGQQRLRTTFTIAEVALAVVLLVAAVVMVQSVRRLLKVDPGFKTEGLLSMQLSVPASQYPKGENIVAFYAEIQRRTQTIPGVERVAVVDELPLTTSGGTLYVQPFGQATPRPGEEQETVVRTASHGYFETMAIPVKSGRTFTPQDTQNSRPIVILSETLARRLFGRADPVGQRVVSPFLKADWEVVGVVGDVRLADLDGGIRPTMYTTATQDPSRSSTLVIRTSADMAGVTAAVRGEVQQMDPELPVYAARSIDETINFTPGVAMRKLVLYLVGAFSFIGTLMAGIGLYGLMSFLVVQRSKEIGIRIALGAERANVRQLVLNRAMAMTWIGLLVGIALAVVGGRFVESVVFGVTPSTPSVLVVVALLVSAIAYLACYMPIRRALRTDPILVLRND
jgi:putative ABC transport system permease protein